MANCSGAAAPNSTSASGDAASAAASTGGHIKQYGIKSNQSTPNMNESAVMEFLLGNVDEPTSNAVSEAVREVDGVRDVRVLRQGL